jgi:hypothetical protein
MVSNLFSLMQKQKMRIYYSMNIKHKIVKSNILNGFNKLF